MWGGVREGVREGGREGLGGEGWRGWEGREGGREGVYNTTIQNDVLLKVYRPVFMYFRVLVFVYIMSTTIGLHVGLCKLHVTVLERTRVVC